MFTDNYPISSSNLKQDVPAASEHDCGMEKGNESFQERELWCHDEKRLRKREKSKKRERVAEIVHSSGKQRNW